MTFIEFIDRCLVLLVATMLALVSLFFVILPGAVVLFVLIVLIVIYEEGRKLFL